MQVWIARLEAEVAEDRQLLHPLGGSVDGELQQLLVGAMAEKQRSLLVLDDPWMPEQVRFLNPIDGSQIHRLLVTTRIRELVPRAKRVELPLMDKEEAVALLLELAGVGRQTM